MFRKLGHGPLQATVTWKISRLSIGSDANTLCLPIFDQRLHPRLAARARLSGERLSRLVV
jgi:hypothetical protein